MQEPTCGVAGLNMDVSTATVLSVKQYPSEEFGVLLHGTGAVVSLRDVKIFIPDPPRGFQGPASKLFGGSHDTRNIVEGVELVLNELGVWNVNTTAFHHSRVTISANGDTGIGCAIDNNGQGSYHNSHGNYYNYNNNNNNNRGPGSYHNKDQGNYNNNGQGNYNNNGQGNYNNNGQGNNNNDRYGSGATDYNVPSRRKHHRSMM
jgi:hypothetical protein